MDTTEPLIDGSDSHPAVAQTLMGVLNEIRWRHPTRRISCGAVIGPTLSVMGSSESSSMKPLQVRRIVGGPARRLVSMLHDASEELVVVDVETDPRFAGMQWIVGHGTRGVLILPLRARDELVGFVRMDAAEPCGFSPAEREALRESGPYVLLAVALELECARGTTRDTSVDELLQSLCVQRARQREAELELSCALVALDVQGAQWLPVLPPVLRAQIEQTLLRCSEHVRAAAIALAPGNASTPRSATTPPSSTATA